MTYENNARQALWLRKQGATYDALADEFGVNKYYIWMFINRPRYQLPCRIKRKLGLIRPRPRRVAIHCTNMKSAADTITNNLDADKIDELIILIKEQSK